jgi:ribosomal protein S9
LKIWTSPEKKDITYYEKSERKRKEYTARVKRVPLKKRVYVDESGIHTHLQREYARSPRGTPVEDVKRGTRFDRVNVIGAVGGGEHAAVGCCRHTTDSAFFERWFETRLLTAIPRGYTVIKPRDHRPVSQKRQGIPQAEREKPHQTPGFPEKPYPYSDILHRR